MNIISHILTEMKRFEVICRKTIPSCFLFSSEHLSIFVFQKNEIVSELYAFTNLLRNKGLFTMNYTSSADARATDELTSGMAGGRSSLISYSGSSFES